MLCLFCVAPCQLSQSSDVVCQFLFILFFGVKGPTMDHPRIGGIKTSSSDHLAVLPVVSHLNEGVDVWVVAWCFVVHVYTIQDLRQKSSDSGQHVDCPVE